MLLSLTDGGILEIESENDFQAGSCETCDYGALYSSQFDIHLTMGIVSIRAEAASDYPLSEGMMMRLVLENVDSIRQMSEKSFVEWFESYTDTLTSDLCSISFLPK